MDVVCARTLAHPVISAASNPSKVLFTTLFTNHTTLSYTTSRQRAQPANGLLTRQRRHAHSRRNVSTVQLPQEYLTSKEAKSLDGPNTSLSCLPLTTLIRSYLITSISSYPFLLKPSLAAMSILAHSKSAFFSPDTNPLLRFLLKRTFYIQFCAGETPAEVKTTIDGLKSMGYKGVIMGHAKEAVLTKEDQAGLDTAQDPAKQALENAADIAMWRNNTVDTIDLAQKDDFVAIKFTGAGRQALQHLKQTIACAPKFEEAVHEMCRKAQDKGVSLLFDAEQAVLQEGIDNWTLYFARKYNKSDRALVYGTYQAYAKKTPAVLAQHLDIARKEGFVLGIKLVRGAYLGSDPRELFWDNIEGTHECYDGIARSVIQRQYNDVLQPAEGGVTDYPQVNLVLASHNAESVRKARALRDEQAENGQPRIRLAYGQLQGMADNVSCEIVQSSRQRTGADKAEVEIPRAYKYLVWGKMSECMKYLLRRANENKDAMSRTIEARDALSYELRRRMGLIR